MLLSGEEDGVSAPSYGSSKLLKVVSVFFATLEGYHDLAFWRVMGPVAMFRPDCVSFVGRA